MTDERFAKFMNERYLHWMQDTGGMKRTVSEFADALESYQGDVSHWLRGSRTPGERVLKRLAQNPIIGPRVWIAAGYPYVVDNEDDLRLLTAYKTLPPALRLRIVEVAEEMAGSPNFQQRFNNMLRDMMSVGA